MFSNENFYNKLVDIIKANLQNDITYATWFEKLKLKEITRISASYGTLRYYTIFCPFVKREKRGISPFIPPASRTNPCAVQITGATGGGWRGRGTCPAWQ